MNPLGLTLVYVVLILSIPIVLKKTFFSFGNFGSTNFATNYDIATSYNYQ